MIVFIDDSGDAGFKLDKGSSRFFVLSCVIFDDELEAEKCAVAIKQLKRDLNFPDQVEFKFGKSNRKVRESFLSTVTKFNFTIRSIVVDKALLRSDELKSSKDSFYGYFTKLLLQHNNNTLQNAKIRIDGSGSRQFRKNFLTYLRKQLNSEDKVVMKHCRLVDSKSNPLIQMADMVAGSIRSSYERNRTDQHAYKDLLTRHIQDEWQFK